MILDDRGVAQLARVPGLGPGGRRFESCLPDQKKLSRPVRSRKFFLFGVAKRTVKGSPIGIESRPVGEWAKCAGGFSFSM